jgi:hypothetical protein
VPHWKALLLIYRELDVRLAVGRWRRPRFHYLASDAEIADATDSFLGFPALVRDLTSGAADVDAEIVDCEWPLRSLTRESESRFWPSPSDTRRELATHAPAGSYDSVFVLWPRHDAQRGTFVPCDAWGLALAASDWSNQATYAAVTTAPSQAWRKEAPGEVWLHEWLHGVCRRFEAQGHVMPDRDADGAEIHGYARSSTVGWTGYYRDLMSGNVAENGSWVGIPLDAWRFDQQLVALANNPVARPPQS